LFLRSLELALIGDNSAMLLNEATRLLDRGTNTNQIKLQASDNLTLELNLLATIF
jgi:hypothetical protein